MLACLFNPVFIFAVAAYLTNRFLVKPSLPPTEVFFRGYFDDLLLIPAALPVVLAPLQVIGVRRQDIPPTAGEIVTVLIVWSLAFEVAGPFVFSRTTGDPYDIVAYASGALIAYFVWNGGSRPLAFAPRFLRGLKTVLRQI
jgi:hypothetical protein